MLADAVSQDRCLARRQAYGGR